jgi:hypothetical protein
VSAAQYLIKEVDCRIGDVGGWLFRPHDTARLNIELLVKGLLKNDAQYGLSVAFLRRI